MRCRDRVQKVHVGRASTLVAAILMVAGYAPQSSAAATPFATLYSFCAKGAKSCTDGAQPQDGVIRDAAGKLYGTTSAGGAHAGGNVFVLTPNAAKTKWTETILYNFCSQGGKNCTDGASPFAGLVMDASAKLYGTTYLGGANKQGTVFELTPNAAKTKWTETVLYSFCARGAGACTDGSGPIASLIRDASGRLYGTTLAGGAHNSGTVFQLAPNAAKTKWTQSVLYSFCSQGGTGCTDGAHSYAAVAGASGKLYGTTAAGGAHKAGVVFQLTPNAAKTKWTYAVLHSFCTQGGAACTDGAISYAGLITDASGKFYGTTYQGGAHNSGAVFALTPNAAKTKWTETILYNFCSRGCVDGALPAAGLVRDKSGDLFGVTELGGTHYSASTEGGVVFELIPNAAKTKWVQTVLYNFCSTGGNSCTDGTEAAFDLVMDAAGDLYGMTVNGGAHNNSGTVFELKR
jgi:uncharacterized repeat protein (TIGR03803 family)